MHTTNLRKVGGSIMLAVPPAFLDQLHLQAGATVGVTVSGGHLVIDPKPRPRYTLAELLAATTAVFGPLCGALTVTPAGESPQSQVLAACGQYPFGTRCWDSVLS